MSAPFVKFFAATALGLVLAGGVGASAFASTTPTPAPTTGSTSVSVAIPGSTGGGGSGGGTGGGGGGSSTSTPTPTPTTGPPPSIPSHAASTRIRLDLDHTTYRPGEVIVAKGHGFRAGESVRFVLYKGPVIVGDFVANGKGVVTAHITLATSIRAGSHVVEAFGWKDGRIASAAFTVNGRAGIGAPNAPWTVWAIGSVAGLGAAIAIAVLGFGKIAGLAGIAGVKVVP